MDRRDRPAFNRLDRCASLRIIEDRCLAWGLGVQQPVRTAGIETDHPVADDLKGDTPEPRCLAPATTIVNLGQCQQPPGLRRAHRVPCQSPKRRSVEILPQANRSTHYRVVLMQNAIESAFRRREKPKMSQPQRKILLASTRLTAVSRVLR